MDQNFYRDLLDSLADGVYFVDRERTVTFWNKAAERISSSRGVVSFPNFSEPDPLESACPLR